MLVLLIAVLGAGVATSTSTSRFVPLTKLFNQESLWASLTVNNGDVIIANDQTKKNLFLGTDCSSGMELQHF